MRGPSASRASPAACMRKPIAARGLAWVCTTVSETGSCGFHAGQRLADDAGEESRCRLVRLARPHHDARQPDADAVAEPAPGVIGEQRFADRLLRAVGGERREMEVVGDRFRERRAEHRDRGGEDHPRAIAVAGRADRLEQRTGAVEVDVVALVEIELGFAGNDAGQMEDHVRPVARWPARPRPASARSRGDRSTLPEKPAGRRRHDDVEQCQPVDRLAVEPAVDGKPFGQLAADHAGRAGDEDVHVVCSLPGQLAARR